MIGDSVVMSIRRARLDLTGGDIGDDNASIPLARERLPVYESTRCCS